MTVTDYLDQLEIPQQRELMTAAHELLLDLIPQVEATVKWKVPFYTYVAPICYLNPVAEHFYFGFIRGSELSNEQGLLMGTDRKLVRLLHIQTLKELFSDSTAEIILEAVSLAEADGRGFESYRGK